MNAEDTQVCMSC